MYRNVKGKKEEEKKRGRRNEAPALGMLFVYTSGFSFQLYTRCGGGG